MTKQDYKNLYSLLSPAEKQECNNYHMERLVLGTITGDDKAVEIATQCLEWIAEYEEEVEK